MSYSENTKGVLKDVGAVAIGVFFVGFVYVPYRVY